MHIMPPTAPTLPFQEREQELSTLTTFYHEGWHRGAGFLLLYGRRGVGKTRLLQQFLQEQAITDVFYWQAPLGDAATQLRDFSQALQRYAPGNDSLPSSNFSFFDWRAALDYLAQITEGSQETKLFILEGFTELCHQTMGVSSYFQHAWDGRLKEIRNLRLILTGSHVSTMIREVLAYSAPLYFRANANLHLRPLRYTALLDLFPDHTPEERLAIFAITGGIPAYLRYFAQAADLPSALEELCFASDSPFLTDMETLFDERLENPALCQAILTAVAAGFNTPNHLSRQVGIPYDDLQHHLYFLRLLKLLEDHNSVDDPIASLRIRHAIGEPSLSFYYQHLKPALGKDGSQKTAAVVYASLYHSLGGQPFISLCREWVWAVAVTKQLDMLPQHVGAYWNDRASTLEFSVAVADLYQKKLLVGEVYWENERLRPAVVGKFVHNSRRIPQVRKEGWEVAQVLFGHVPFSPEMQEVAATAGVRLVWLNEIEPLLLAARHQQRWERDHPSKVEIEF